MIHKTEGIVLRTLRHQDSNLIATLYTRDFGVRSFIVKGFRAATSRKRYSYFQPLSIVDLVFRERPNRDLQQLDETRIAYLLQDLQTHPVKLSLGLAMVEIFFDTVKEEEANPELFDFFREVLLLLDRSEQRLVQLFVYFLVHLTRHLGFFPNDESEAALHVRFDPREGCIVAATPGEPVAVLLRRLVHSEAIALPDDASCQHITFDQATKRQLIATLFEYYQLHVSGFRYPQTMRVFAEIFG
ncbi:MAG: DNA repair protein RecO [Bacteroidia bacterium]